MAVCFRVCTGDDSVLFNKWGDSIFNNGCLFNGTGTGNIKGLKMEFLKAQCETELKAKTLSERLGSEINLRLGSAVVVLATMYNRNKIADAVAELDGYFIETCHDDARALVNKIGSDCLQMN